MSSSESSRRSRSQSPSEPNDSATSIRSVPENPAVAFAASLEEGDRSACIACLAEHFSLVTRPASAFEWLQEPLAMGISLTTIVDILLEEKEQSPWICYDLRRTNRPSSGLTLRRGGYHQTIPQILSRGDVFRPFEIEVKRIIAELCGLCGITPRPTNLEIWQDHVSVLSHDRSAIVSYATIYGSNSPGWIQRAFDQCHHALYRLLDILRWLRLNQRVRTHIIVLRLQDSSKVEAVQIPFGLVTKLDAEVSRATRYFDDVSGRISKAALVRDLCAASSAILCLISNTLIESWIPGEPSLENAVHLCAVAVQAPCGAMLSFSQAHIGEIDPFFLEHSLSHITLCGSNPYESGSPSLCLTLVSLSCVGNMVDSQVMVFTDSPCSASNATSGAPGPSSGLWSHENDTQTPRENSVETVSAQVGVSYDLVITLQDALDLWGPGEFMPCERPDTTDEPLTLYDLFRTDKRVSIDDIIAKWSNGLIIRGGVIYQPSTDSVKMHWAANIADSRPEGVPFKVDLMMPVTIGGLDLINTRCPTKPDSYHNIVARTNLSTSIEDLGTWPESWNLREIQCGAQAGQYLNAVYNATWIKSNGQTVKERGLEEVDLDFLNRPWGLLISVCTGVAQRVALREVVAEVMRPMLDARIEKTLECKDLLTGQGLIKELRKPTFRAWADSLSLDEQRTLNRNVCYVLRKICWTGINGASKLVVSCPMSDRSNACVHVSMKEFRALRSILKDTERSATFACLTNACFTVEPWFGECQKTTRPPWKNQISALVTSVCQYQWSGVNDWTKLPQDELEDEGVYWMGSNDDKRRVTANTGSPHPCRLKIQDRPTHWLFFRRAWERLGKIRKVPFIELRERSLMTEDYAKEVVMMREQDA